MFGEQSIFKLKVYSLIHSVRMNHVLNYLYS